MTEQWKPIGDKWPQPAMVWVMRADENNCARIINGGDRDWLPLSFLHPMPPTITPEQQAVLNAAEVQAKTGLNYEASQGEYNRACARTNLAVRAMLAAQQPSDPVKELRAAWNAISSVHPNETARMEAAIAALEAKS
jgi:hypothetical protein